MTKKCYGGWDSPSASIARRCNLMDQCTRRGVHALLLRPEGVTPGHMLLPSRRMCQQLARSRRRVGNARCISLPCAHLTQDFACTKRIVSPTSCIVELKCSIGSSRTALSRFSRLTSRWMFKSVIDPIGSPSDSIWASDVCQTASPERCGVTRN